MAALHTSAKGRLKYLSGAVTDEPISPSTAGMVIYMLWLWCAASQLRLDVPTNADTGKNGVANAPP